MADIIKLLIIVFVAYQLLRAVIFTVKRVIMLSKIHSLKRDLNANICLHKFPFSPFVSRGEKPDITIEIFDTVYAIRLYSGISSNRFVHFVDEKFSVVYKKMRAMVMPSRAASRVGKGVRLSYSTGGHVNVMGNLSLPDCKKRVVKILLFSPAPYEVSYVTEERSTIHLAFTGDMLYGYRVFTPSTLVTFIDREKRREEDRRKENCG